MAWDWLKKYMVGTQGQDLGIFGPNRSVAPTSGLFGTGGNFGKGGLLTTFNQPGTSGLYNMFSNPYINIGAAMAAKGFQGKGVGESLFPSVKEGLSFTEGVEKIKSAKKKRDFIKKYESQVPEGDLELFRAFPEKYVSAMLTKRTQKNTLADAAKSIYDKIQMLPDADQAAAIKKLPKIEQELYKKYIKGEFDLMEWITEGDMAKAGDWKEGQIITLKNGKKGRIVGFKKDGTPIIQPV
jgi:plasmid maintenance system killer protein